MSNMSYCRFQNTTKDLEDCYEALQSIMDGEETISNDELRALKNLLELCKDITDSFEFEDIKEELKLTKQRLKEEGDEEE